jgi:hypothetical protein
LLARYVTTFPPDDRRHFCLAYSKARMSLLTNVSANTPVNHFIRPDRDPTVHQGLLQDRHPSDQAHQKEYAFRMEQGSRKRLPDTQECKHRTTMLLYIPSRTATTLRDQRIGSRARRMCQSNARKQMAPYCLLLSQVLRTGGTLRRPR